LIAVDAARTHYRAADSAHDFDHVLRVLRLAYRIAEAEGAELETVHDAALLHDVGRARARSEGLDHAVVGAEMAHKILAGQESQHVNAVAETIRTHRYRSGSRPTTLEAKVLFDADKLDAIGAIGVARAYALGGARGQRLWAPLNDVSELLDRGDEPDAHTPVHEYAVKLVRLRDILYTRTGRELAEARHRFMVAFFEQLGREVRGEM
jgi:uncharacterized protein